MNESDAIEQLAALLDGTADAATAPSSLTALLSLADTVRTESDILAPSLDFRAALRAELVTAGTPQTTLAERLRAGWIARTQNVRSSARVAVAAMTASSMLGTAGMAMAAQQALPGDALYSMKGWTEQVRLMLATDDLAEARLHLAFAAERLEELELGAATLTSDQVVELLRRMDEASKAGADAMLDGAASGAITLDELRDFTDTQRFGLANLLNDLPLLAQHSAEDSLELLRRINVNATGSITPADLDSCDCPGDSRNRFLPTENANSIVSAIRPRVTLPGSGEAAIDLGCDCIDAPGGTDAREPGTTGAKDPEPDQVATTDEAEEEPQERPFEPGSGLSNPDPGTDSDDGEGSISTGVNTLPLDDISEGVGSITGTEPDTSAADRAAATLDDTSNG